MITAQQLLRNQKISDKVPDMINKDGEYWFVDVTEGAVVAMMQEFARQHVKAALDAIDEDFYYYGLPSPEGDYVMMNINDLKRTYPLTKIK